MQVVTLTHAIRNTAICPYILQNRTPTSNPSILGKFASLIALQ